MFYDTTPVDFSIDMEDEETEDDEALWQYGRPMPVLAKAGNGSWSVQMVVALAVTRQGLPVRSWVFPGSTAGVATVAEVKRDLKGWKLGRALFVGKGDGGLNSEENRHELAKACGTYLLATRLNSVSMLCDLMGLPRSSYYYVPHPPDDRELRDAIERTCLRYTRYGYRRVTPMLKREQYRVGEERVRLLMGEMGLQVQQRRRKVRTTVSEGEVPYPNLLKGLDIQYPDHVWCGDLSYIISA